MTFDDVRAARAAQLLRELSSDFQVIYLACSDRYDGLADAVVVLPGPSGAIPEPAALAEPAPAIEPEASPEPAAVAEQLGPEVSAPQAGPEEQTANG